MDVFYKIPSIPAFLLHVVENSACKDKTNRENEHDENCTHSYKSHTRHCSETYTLMEQRDLVVSTDKERHCVLNHCHSFSFKHPFAIGCGSLSIIYIP